MARKRYVIKLLGLAFWVFSACGTKAASPPPPADGRQELRVTVDAQGFHPSELHVPANKPIRLLFTRTSDEGCAHQVAVPSLSVRRDLPLNEPVAVDLTTPASGAVNFACGMDMFTGSVVVQ